MTYKKKTLAGSFAVVVAAGAISVSVASAHMGSNSERREPVQNAIKNNDFKAFTEATDGCLHDNKINTEEEFAAMTLAYNLRQENKYKEAKEVLERAGIEHPGYNRINRKNAPNINEALKNKDWQEFQETVKNKGIAKIIDSKDKFNLFVEMYELRKLNRHDEAMEIMHDLGLKKHEFRFMK